MESPVHVLMLSIQAVRGLTRLRAVKKWGVRIESDIVRVLHFASHTGKITHWRVLQLGTAIII